MKKALGILGLLVFVCVITAAVEPRFIQSAYNLENLVRWTALFGILSIGVAFVIITGGIDLSIGSVVGLVGCLLPFLLREKGLPVGVALPIVLVLPLLLGLVHGVLITKLRLQPFVVTLCGLLFYRGFARYLTDDLTQSFGGQYEGLRRLATGKPCSMMLLFAILLGAAFVALGIHWRRQRARGARARSWAFGTAITGLLALFCGLVSGAGWKGVAGIPLGELRAPMPFLLLILVALAAGLLLNRTVVGRHLFALGRNERAARYSGIRTDRLVILAYGLCSALAGLGGVLFALDVNSVQPAVHGSFYELYAIAAAVLGGCSLRGGEGSILGVVIGAAVMRVLYNSINLLEIPTHLEFAIIGAVILLGVIADELIQRMVARRRAARGEASH